MSDWLYADTGLVDFLLVAGWVTFFVAVLRFRRPMRPVGRYAMRRINTTIDTQQEGER